MTNAYTYDPKTSPKLKAAPAASATAPPPNPGGADIRRKALLGIVKQLDAVVGAQNYCIRYESEQYGDLAPAPQPHTEKKRTYKRVHDFRGKTAFYDMIGALAVGDVCTLEAPGVPVAAIQAAASGICAKLLGAGNYITSRNANGTVDVLRLA